MHKDMYKAIKIEVVVITAVVVSSSVFLGLITILGATTTAAYGQQQQPPNDVKIIESDVIRKNISDVFVLDTGSPNGPKLKNYTLYENGTGKFTFEVQVHPFVLGTRGDTTTMTILMDHPWGAAQGYIYNSTGIYTPDGSQRLIIATTN